MLKKIRIITSYPLSNEPVIRNRITPLLNVSRENNFSVNLYSTDEKLIDYKYENFRHINLPSKKNKPRSFMKRAKFEMVESYRLLKSLPSEHCDLEIITVPSMFLLFAILFFEKGRFHVDLRDLTWEYLGNGKVNNIAKKVFRLLAKKSLLRAKSISVTNTSELKYVESIFKCSPKSGVKVSLVPNGVSLLQFEKLRGLNKIERNMPQKSLIVSYIGNVGIGQDLTTLIEAARLMPDIEVNIVGGGTDFDRIKMIVDENKVSNVILHGRVPWDDVLKVYEKTDVLYAQLTETFSTAVPSKLYEYLSTGKFILYGGSVQAKKLLSLFDNNTVIEPSNPQVLAKQIVRLRANATHTYVSEKNINLIEENFIRENTMSRLLQESLY